MLLIDGVKYELWTPPTEDEFERVVEKHAEELFGKDAKYFDLKHKLASRSGTGSIPDGYIITIGDKPKVQIIEFELESHSLQHIVSQMVNIMNGIANSTTQQKICNAIEDGINEDDIFTIKITKAIKPVSIHRFLSDNFSNTLPTINIIIDQSWPALEEAVNKINPPPKIIEFKTFKREEVGIQIHAHLFEPLYKITEQKSEKVSETRETTPMQREDLFISEIKVRITPASIKYGYIPFSKEHRHLFPGYDESFILVTDIGELRTHVTGAPAGTVVGEPNAGNRIGKNLKPWYTKHRELQIGNEVSIKTIEPMKKYRLEIV